MKIILEVVLCLLGGFVLFLTLLYVHFQWKLRKHHGIPKAAFLAHFAELGLSEYIAAAVYEYYRSHAIWRSFSVMPEDDIATLFNQTDDGIEDDFIVVLKKLDLERPYDSAWDSWGNAPVKTIEDFVRLVVWASKNQPGGNSARSS